MDISNITKNPLATALMGFIGGLVLGLFVLGWGIWPVKWTDATPQYMSDAAKMEYVNLLADSMAENPAEAPKIVERFRALDARRNTALEAALAAAANNPEQLADLQTLKSVLQAAQATTNTKILDDVTLLPQSPLAAFIDPLLWCSLLIIIIGWAALIYLYPQAVVSDKPKTAGQQAVAARKAAQEEKTDYTSAEAVAATPTGAPPVAQFMTTYVLGDDLFDDSFSVEDAPGGSGFLGECGMGISETIGVGDPKKVTAFEAWIFDKNDIRTVTKVLMSEHAFRDEALKSRLAAKGEPVMIEPGKVISLDTASLVIQVRIVDMAYGGGALPPNSFLERLTVELAAFKKQTA